MPNSANQCARALIEVIPDVMEAIRTEVRGQRGPELSVMQFRVLAFLERHPGAPLSVVAEQMGLTPPSMSTQVTGLVARNLVDRATSLMDRRYVTLKLTAQGQAVLKSAHQGAQANLAELLTQCSEDERATLLQALQLLRSTFSPTKTILYQAKDKTKDKTHE